MIGSRKKKDLKEIDITKKFYANILKRNQDVDDITWNDLNMDDVFLDINKTNTTSGEHMLYDMLRKSEYTIDELKRRDGIISWFQKNENMRHKVSSILSKYDKSICNMEYIFRVDKDIVGMQKLMCVVAILISLISLVGLIFFNSTIAAVIFVVAICANTWIYDSLREKYTYDILGGAEYLGKMLVMSELICEMQCEELKDEISKLKIINEKCKAVRKKSSLVLWVNNLGPIGGLVDYILLITFFNLFSMIKCVDKYRDELLEGYKTLGYIDALYSVSLYRESLDTWCKPVFVDERVMKIQDLYHPLIDNPKKNSIEIESNGIIITGSNMSGKSTFLRTLGINTILSQTIYTSISKNYVSSFYKVISSISISDDIDEGKSYYLCEAEAIKRMIDNSGKDVRCLALIDEIFKGTNPIERVNAAAEILEYLGINGALTLVATHDIALTDMVNGYDNYYFREEVVEDKFKFDYLIKKGISPTKNAVKILEFIGYPKELIQGINNRIGN